MSDSLQVKKRITLMMTLMDASKAALLSDLTGKMFPSFFDFEDEELDARVQEIDEKEELSESDMLELAAIYFIMYLKDELENS